MKYSGTLVAVFVGVLISISLLGIGEVIFKLNETRNFLSLPLFGYRQIPGLGELSQDVKEAEQASQAWFLQSRMSKWRSEYSNDQTYNRSLFKKTFTPNFPVSPGRTLRSSVVRAEMNLMIDPVLKVYDVHYTLDEQGRRAVPATKLTAQKAMVMMGCSFTFGEGIEDDQTTSNALAELLPNLRIVNYGNPGYGVSEFLEELRLASPKADMGGVPVDIVVFTMIQDHVDRMLCSHHYCSGRMIDRLDAARYYPDTNGEIQFTGTYREHFPWNQRWYMGLGDSALVRDLNLFNFAFSDSDYEVAAKIVGELKRQTMERWGAQHFVVAFYPEGVSLNFIGLARALAKQNIDLIDLSRLDLAKVTDGRHKLPFDRHPSPAGAYAYAAALEYLLSEKGWVP